MKKLLLFAVCLAFIWQSCNKSTAPVLAATSAISATIDGSNENFNTVDSSGYRNTPTYYSAFISAKNGTSSTADKMELDIYSPTPIAVGTYNLTKNYNPPFGILIIYKINGSSNFANDYVVDYTGNHPASITISSISTTNIQGAFNGTLIVANNSGATKTISDGKFNIDLK
ncbi:hypothetical protein FSB76_17525 [Mucilaginibacter ginsenosidivorax]|uniref:Uncharacterized protein n=2 Tax=Mucilaginibacter ginsenosidivorax TaxID=862126 RepID=A0A5B8W3Y1_9SPHI|nr:hypothetical protein FSB76_17525 [Mucilaginibacter ginsenosidivorax]